MSDNPQDQPQTVAPNQQTPTAARENMLRTKFGENWDAADESYRNIVTQRQELEQKLNEASGVINELVQRASPMQQTQRRSAFDRLADIGLPPDTIREAMADVVREELKPLARGLQARDAIISEYPEFAQEEAQFQRFLKDNKGVQEKYTRLGVLDPEMALEWGIAKYKEHRGATGTPTSGAERAQAQLPNTVQQSGGRSVPDPGTPDPEKLQKALDYYKQTGDDRPLLQERLKGQGHPSFQ